MRNIKKISTNPSQKKHAIINILGPTIKKPMASQHSAVVVNTPMPVASQDEKV